MRLDQFDYSLTAHTGRAAEITVHSNREAYACILEGMDRQLKDGELCEALARHDDFCELVAQVAVIRKLQRELDNRDATDADHGIINELRRSANPWIHREAGNLLMLIADERDQVAAHDGEAEAPEKRYRLRCGAIVVIPKASEWTAPIKFVDVSQADFGSRELSLIHI